MKKSQNVDFATLEAKSFRNKMKSWKNLEPLLINEKMKKDGLYNRNFDKYYKDDIYQVKTGKVKNRKLFTAQSAYKSSPLRDKFSPVDSIREKLLSRDLSKHVYGGQNES